MSFSASLPPDPPPIEWIGHAAVAWGSQGWKPWSKNTAWTTRVTAKAGQRIRTLTTNAKRKQKMIGTMLIRSLLGKPKPKQGEPWWVAIHVVAPDKRGDPPNVLDIVLDAVQKATGLNDRYARVFQLTAEVDRVNPGVLLWFGVER